MYILQLGINFWKHYFQNLDICIENTLKLHFGNIILKIILIFLETFLSKSYWQELIFCIGNTLKLHFWKHYFENNFDILGIFGNIFIKILEIILVF